MSTLPVYILVFLALTCTVHSEIPAEITLGGIIPTDIIKIGGPSLLSAIQIAVERVNADSSLLPNTQLKLVYETFVTGGGPNPGQSLRVANLLLSKDIPVMLGPFFSIESLSISPLLNRAQVPYLSPWATNDLLSQKDKYKYFGRVLPSDGDYSLGLTSIMDNFGWTRYALVHSQDEYGLVAMSKFETEAQNRGWVQVKRLALPLDPTTEVDLSALKASGVRIIFVHSPSFAHAQRIAEQAQALNMNNGEFVFIVTESLTLSLLAVAGTTEAAPFAGWLGMVTQTNPEDSPLLQSFVTDFQSRDPTLYPGAGPGAELGVVPTLAAEAVYAFAHALHQVIVNDSNAVWTSRPLSSTSTSSGSDFFNHIPVWDIGPAILSSIRSLNYTGMTGRVTFGSTGDRGLMPFNVYNVRANASVPKVGIINAGQYTPVPGASIIYPSGYQGLVNDFDALKGRTLRAVTQEYAPWLIYDASKTGKEAWSGVVPDLLAIVARYVGFKYTLERSNDTWSQMALDTGAGRYDILAANMMMTEQRQQFATFSTPFVSEGISIVTAPVAGKKNPVLFLEPFHWTMWLAVLLAPLIVAHVLWASERWHADADTRAGRRPKAIEPGHAAVAAFNPEVAAAPAPTRRSRAYDDDDDDGGDGHHLDHYRHNDDDDDDDGTADDGGGGDIRQRHRGPQPSELTARPSSAISRHGPKPKVSSTYRRGIVDSLWFSYSSFFGTQETGRLNSSSAKVFSLVWLFSTLIIVASYTANVTALLTNQRLLSAPVEGKEDLMQRTIRVGVQPGDFVKPTVEAELNRETLDCGGYLACFSELKKGEIDAYVQLTTFIEYWIKRDPYCGLSMTGRPFREMVAGFMFPKDFAYAIEFDQGLSRALADGSYNALVQQYFNQEATCDDVDASAPVFLTFEDVSGLFLFLFLALIGAAVCAGGLRWRRKLRRE